MELQQRSRTVGRAVIVLALLLRLQLWGVWGKLAQWIVKPNIAPFLTQLETGRNVRFSASKVGETLHEAESPPPWQPQGVLPVFTEQDADGLQLYYTCSLRPDVQTLMAQPLRWYLPLPEPTVLILHSHATETYVDYADSPEYRTLDEKHNMVSIGAEVARILEESGIRVIHDRRLHDYPSYTAAYGNSRTAMETCLEENPSIQLVLDLHRDASDGAEGQLRTLANVEGQAAGQLMLVMGTDAGGLYHENWQQNLSLALKLQNQLEQQAPGITRPIQLRSQRFNQDLSPGALLVEVGAAGNTHEEAIIAARQLAYAIVALSRGTQ